MDIESYKALSQVIVHDTLSVVKQLQKELAKDGLVFERCGLNTG